MTYYEIYTESVSDEIKKKLREEDLKTIGLLPDDSETFTDEESLKQAFKDRLEN